MLENPAGWGQGTTDSGSAGCGTVPWVPWVPWVPPAFGTQRCDLLDVGRFRPSLEDLDHKLTRGLDQLAAGSCAWNYSNHPIFRESIQSGTNADVILDHLFAHFSC